MSDIDCNSEMTTFHRDEVTLSQKQQGNMRRRRDAGRTRLNNGLDQNSHPHPKEIVSQGSYQMRTMVQDENKEYDIDDGSYFKKIDLVDSNGKPLTPLAARERVRDALKWDGRLKQEAVVKRNCVRQEYPEGYHIDVPVYRIMIREDKDGNNIEYYELASGDEWVESDARAVTRWYNGLVGELNAGESDGSQMRRITKLTKKFSRRTDWKDKTTSGICITRLVVDHFVSVENRDDKSLRQTWKAIHEKLETSTEIKHPVLDSNLAEKDDDELKFFDDCLADALKALEGLDNHDCDRQKARAVWDEVFDTSFFTNQPDKKDKENSAFVITSQETARRNDGGGRFG
ncbi:cyclic GMP-AMP synthase DncV-like nucleotidyltransferase [Thiothrix nivea]|uniref:Cyclic GMP-AMP synthase n=1 Tax=Thiothrix nivea (strain ATCC 35100 / DSM 5205 / JP2) TaxID=870187 RepID=A0A656HEW9_THINJ|nr:hypothetical protein [Thiothrix nivea]EIJ34967.1 hypothetical protein Thini_2414 [Thiothrix nivea DSM 5205]